MRQEKQLLLDEIKDEIENAPALVLLSYSNLDPNKAAELRSSFKKTGGNIKVASKRVLLKAANEAGIEFNKESLKGHVAVATTGEDTIESTKAIYNYSKDNEDTIEVLAGFFDGAMLAPSDVKELSKLPSKDQMRSQFIGLLQAPMQQTVSVMNNVLTSVPCCLENKVKKEEGAE